MVVIANRTGWDEDYIRWRLPLARGFPYYHAARLLDGEECRWPKRGGTEGARQAEEVGRKIREAARNFTMGNR